MPPEAFSARLTYLAQAETHQADPRAAAPDVGLLTVDPHGPFKTIRAGIDPTTNRPAIYFRLQNGERGERWAPPEVFLMVILLLAFGGGCSVNANVGGDGGWAYVRLWGGHQRTMSGRLTTNAGRGEVVKQDPSVDHHDLSPRNFWLTGGDEPQVALGGTPPGDAGTRRKKSPHRGRHEAITTALQYYRTNHHRSPGLTLTEGEYKAVLERAFRLLDAVHSDRGSGSGMEVSSVGVPPSDSGTNSGTGGTPPSGPAGAAPIAGEKTPILEREEA